MNISVLGCGRWGSFHAWYADHIGHAVTLWGRKGSRHLAALVEQRKNEYLTLPDSVQLTDDLAGAVASADIIVISISSQQLRSFCRDLVALGIDLSGKRFVLCMKGLENASTSSRVSFISRAAMTMQFGMPRTKSCTCPGPTQTATRIDEPSSS